MAVLLAGCSTYAAQRYSIYPDNVVALRALGPVKVNVDDFTASQPGLKEVDCRAVGPIKTPDGEAFEDYVRKALVDELKIAEVYADDAPVTLTGNLDKLDFSSWEGIWTLSLTVTSSNGQSLSVDSVHDYDSSFVGEVACNQGAQAFVLAVQNLISNLVRHPDFKNLVET